MAKKTDLVGACSFHGEYHMDASDSPCPACADWIIGYCDLSLDEVCAENCVECQNWDSCEYVMATVIPDLLERMLDWDNAPGHVHWAGGEGEISHDLVYAIIARLKRRALCLSKR